MSPRNLAALTTLDVQQPSSWLRARGMVRTRRRSQWIAALLLVISWLSAVVQGGRNNGSFASIFGTGNVILQRSDGPYVGLESARGATMWGPIGSSSNRKKANFSLRLSGPTSGDVVDVQATISKDGKRGEWLWSATLPPKSGSTTNVYSLELLQSIDGNSPTVVAALNNVRFGDVYVCSGQSNAGLALKNTYDQKYVTEALSSNNLVRTRLKLTQLGVARPDPIKLASKKPSTFLREAPALQFQDFEPDAILLNPSALNDLPAACVSFGIRLIERLGSASPPIGIVASSFGGTSIESWSAPRQKKSKRCKGASTKLDRFKRENELYNGMVHPLTRMAVSGFVWIQGESNLKNPGTVDLTNPSKSSGYGCLLPKMITEWRDAFQVPKALFAVVTVPPGAKLQNSKSEIPALRLSQLRTMQILDNVRVVQAYDLGDPWPQNRACKKQGCCADDQANSGQNFSPAPVCIDTSGLCSNPLSGDWCTEFVIPDIGGVHQRNKLHLADRVAAVFKLTVYDQQAADDLHPAFQSCLFPQDETKVVVKMTQDIRVKTTAQTVPDIAFQVCGVTGTPSGVCECHQWSRKGRKYKCESGARVNLSEDPESYWVAVSTLAQPKANGSGSNRVTIFLPDQVPTTADLRAIRYAWVANPNCDWYGDSRIQGGTAPCPLANCRISARNSDTGPLVPHPFFLTVQSGNECTQIA